MKACYVLFVVVTGKINFNFIMTNSDMNLILHTPSDNNFVQSHI